MVAVCAELPEEQPPEADVSEAWAEIDGAMRVAAARLRCPPLTLEQLQVVEFACAVLAARLARLAQRQA